MAPTKSRSKYLKDSRRPTVEEEETLRELVGSPRVDRDQSREEGGEDLDGYASSSGSSSMTSSRQLTKSSRGTGLFNRYDPEDRAFILQKLGLGPGVGVVRKKKVVVGTAEENGDEEPSPPSSENGEGDLDNVVENSDDEEQNSPSENLEEEEGSDKEGSLDNVDENEEQSASLVDPNFCGDDYLGLDFCDYPCPLEQEVDEYGQVPPLKTLLSASTSQEAWNQLGFNQIGDFNLVEDGNQAARLATTSGLVGPAWDNLDDVQLKLEALLINCVNKKTTLTALLDDPENEEVTDENPISTSSTRNKVGKSKSRSSSPGDHACISIDPRLVPTCTPAAVEEDNPLEDEKAAKVRAKQEAKKNKVRSKFQSFVDPYFQQVMPSMIDVVDEVFRESLASFDDVNFGEGVAYSEYLERQFDKVVDTVEKSEEALAAAVAAARNPSVPAPPPPKVTATKKNNTPSSSSSSSKSVNATGGKGAGKLIFGPQPRQQQKEQQQRRQEDDRNEIDDEIRRVEAQLEAVKNINAVNAVRMRRMVQIAMKVDAVTDKLESVNSRLISMHGELEGVKKVIKNNERTNVCNSALSRDLQKLRTEAAELLKKRGELMAEFKPLEKGLYWNVS